MRQILSYLMIAGLVLSVAGCRFGPVQDRSLSADQREAAERDAARDQRFAGDLGRRADMQALDDPASPLARRVVYFAFDSSQVNSEGQELIAAHARFLAQNPNVSVILEGHTDERGTREYNLALGERRAKSVQQLMQVQGVLPDQIQVISFGEERPVALDHNESAWRLNRRVELLYSGY